MQIYIVLNFQLAANLKCEGKMKLDDKVIDYLPNFHFGNQQSTKKIEVAHLLSHTTGTPYHTYTDLVESGLSISSVREKGQIY